MRTKLYIFIFTFLLVTPLYSQYGWEIQMGGSYIGSTSYRDIAFLNNSTGYLLSLYRIKKTIDGGNSWQEYIFPDTNYSLSSFIFLDLNTGFATGRKTVKTTNAGVSWQLLDSSFRGYSIFFIDGQTGWIGGSGGRVYKTINAGVQWDSLSTGITDNINALCFTTPLNGYCAADWGNLLRTTNGGTNWIKYVNPALTFYSDITFINPNTGIASGTGGTISRTTNAGVNWLNYYSTGGTANLNSMCFTDQNTGYAFGSFGTIVKTTNSGLNWVVLSNTNLFSTVNASSCRAGSDIWITSDSGMVHRSASGISYSLVLKQSKTFEAFSSVYFLNSQTGWTCGSNGALFMTTSGGVNWISKNAGTAPGVSLSTILFINDNTGYFCGGKADSLNNGIVRKTIDGGQNWNTVLNDTLYFNSMSFADANTGWAGGDYGGIKKTTDGGMSWIQFNTTLSSREMDIKFLNASTGIVCGDVVLRTTNGGFEWTNVLYTSSGSYIHFVDQNTGYLKHGNINPIMLRTTNAGLNWSSTLPAMVSGAFYSFYFSTVQTGWLCGRGMIKQTTNGCQTWQLQPNPLPLAFLYSVCFVNNNEGWVVGASGVIMHTRTSGIGITQISTNIPSGYLLGQNYPNPFNPVTKIRFQIPVGNGRDRSIMKIYDVIGREISTLVNEILSPGTYEVNWDASNYPSGAYFYRLSTGNFIQTKKMVVLK